MSKRLGEIKGCKYKKKLFFMAFKQVLPDADNIGSTV